MYKVTKQWGDGVSGVVGPAVGDVIELPAKEADERLASGEIEVYEDKRSNAKSAPTRSGGRSK